MMSSLRVSPYEYYLGVDPGAQGALCLLRPDDTATFMDMVSIDDHIAISALFLWIQSISDSLPISVVIENVHSISGTAAKANFNFGRNVGSIQTLLRLNFANIDFIQPKCWQEKCGITFKYPKDATANQKSKLRKLAIADKASELYPGCDIYGPRGGLKDGRADALMIAHAYKEICNER